MWVWSGAWGAQQAAAASLLEFADDHLAPIHIAMQQWKQLGQNCGMSQGLENKHGESPIQGVLQRKPLRVGLKVAKPHACSLEALSHVVSLCTFIFLLRSYCSLSHQYPRV